MEQCEGCLTISALLTNDLRNEPVDLTILEKLVLAMIINLRFLHPEIPISESSISLLMSLDTQCVEEALESLHNKGLINHTQ